MGTEMTEGARRRRLQDTLSIAGGGVIAFGAWTLAKTAVFFALTDEGQLVHYTDIPSVFVLYAMTAFIVLADLLVRVYVGLSARAEGRGRKRGFFYLVAAVLAALVNACSGIAAISGMTVTLSVIDAAISVIIDGTALAALVLVVWCSMRLRRMDALRK